MDARENGESINISSFSSDCIPYLICSCTTPLKENEMQVNTTSMWSGITIHLTQKRISTRARGKSSQLRQHSKQNNISFAKHFIFCVAHFFSCACLKACAVHALAKCQIHSRKQSYYYALFQYQIPCINFRFVHFY